MSSGASTDAPRVAVLPNSGDVFTDAIENGGGIVSRVADAQALIWTDPLHPEGLAGALDDSPVRWVQLPFAGIESFIEAGVIDPALIWTCAKGIYGPACAEHAVALILAVSRCIPEHARARHWIHRDLEAPEFRVAGETVVVFGTGGIGRALVPMVTALGMQVIGVNRSGKPLEGATRTATTDELPDVLGEARFAVVAAALTPETTGIFDARMLARMRENAWIVNVARGRLIVTDDLVQVLEAGSIGGAALDVTDPEPLPDDHPLWKLDNCLITPHIANTWAMGLAELPGLVRRNVAHFGAGEELEGLVDPTAGY